MQAFLDGVPMVMVQCGVVTAWAIYFWGGWSLAIALLGFPWVTILGIYGLWVLFSKDTERLFAHAGSTV